MGGDADGINDLGGFPSRGTAGEGFSGVGVHGCVSENDCTAVGTCTHAWVGTKKPPAPGEAPGVKGQPFGPFGPAGSDQTLKGSGQPRLDESSTLGEPLGSSLIGRDDQPFSGDQGTGGSNALGVEGT